MLQSIGRGWTFIKQSWLLSKKTPAVLFPTLTGIFITILTMSIILLPLAGLFQYVRKNIWGQVAIGALIGILLAIILAVIHVMTVMSSNIAGQALLGRKPSTADAWKKVFNLGGDLYIMGLGLPVYHLWLAIHRIINKSSSVRKWEEAGHLLIPVLANEEIPFRQVPYRISHMQSENCVFTADGVGIKKIGMILTAAAFLIGLSVSWLILTQGENSSHSRALALTAAIFLTGIFLLPVVSYLTYAKTLFNTCLYLWGRSIQEARKQDSTSTAAVPEPLAVALGIRSGR